MENNGWLGFYTMAGTTNTRLRGAVLFDNGAGRGARLAASRRTGGGVRSGNAADAARKAGYSGNNHAQAVEGQRLLTNVDIRARVEKRREEAKRRAQLHTDELVGRL